MRRSSSAFLNAWGLRDRLAETGCPHDLVRRGRLRPNEAEPAPGVGPSNGWPHGAFSPKPDELYPRAMAGTMEPSRRARSACLLSVPAWGATRAGAQQSQKATSCLSGCSRVIQGRIVGKWIAESGNIEEFTRAGMVVSGIGTRRSSCNYHFADSNHITISRCYGLRACGWHNWRAVPKWRCCIRHISYIRYRSLATKCCWRAAARGLSKEDIHRADGSMTWVTHVRSRLAIRSWKRQTCHRLRRGKAA